MSATRHTVFFELRDALSDESCAMCALILRALRRYFDAATYEHVNDGNLRARVRAARGFCATHTQLLRESRSALGTAIISRDVLTNLGRAMREDREGRRRGGLARLFGDQTVQRLAPQGPCPACEYRREREDSYADALLQHINDPVMSSRFASSAGLCAPHLRVVLSHNADPAAVERLRSIQERIWERLGAELDEFIRKQDAQFTGETSGSERDSWSRAALLIAGDPRI
jgi:hypothetical protein